MQLLRLCASAPLRLCALAFVIAAVTGCDSGRSDPTFGSANFGPASGSGGPDLSDSHFEANLTVEFNTTVALASPMFDAQTGQMTSQMALNMPPTHFAIQAGYDSRGVFTFDQTALDPAGNLLTDDVDDVRKVQIRNSIVTLIDGNGYAAAGTEAGAGPSLLSILGAQRSEQLVFLDGLVLTAFPQTGTTTQRPSPDGTSATVSNVTTSGSQTTVATIVHSTNAATPDLAMRRTYTQSGSDYILTEVQTDVASQTAGASMTGTATVRFDGVSYSRNAQKDAARRAGTAPNAWSGPAGGGIQYLEPAPCDRSNPENNCHVSPGGGTSGPGGCSTVANGATLVYVHGIQSDSTAWGNVTGTTTNSGGVIGSVRCDLLIAPEMTPSLTAGGLKGTGSHVSQAAQLLGRVGGRVPQPIFVAHSQGGLISRRVAQTLGQANVRAVITTGTPHQGAPIANTLNPGGGISGAIRLFSGGAACRFVSCGPLSAGLVTFRDVFLAAQFSSPAMADLRPASNAIRDVNTPTETFPRYGITNSISRRWAFARVAGDFLSDNSGLTVEKWVKRVYWGAVVGSVVSSFIPFFHPLAVPLLVIATVLDQTDRWWSRITVGNQQGDGVVPTPSQEYPRSEIADYKAPSPASSHTGEADTRQSALTIEFVLRERLFIPQR